LGFELAAFSFGLGGFSLTSGRFRLSARGLGWHKSYGMVRPGGLLLAARL
jgi:hypothetical protein